MPDSTSSRNLPRIATWTVTILLAALYAGVTGPAKVMGAEKMVEGFRAWGYPDAFRIFIGLCEIAGGIGLLIPRLATWAALGLACVMAGAAYTHLHHGVPNAWFPGLLLLALLAIAYLRRGRALFSSRADEPARETPDPV
ncbi:MAG: DoxX family protein [Myxococcota bacterium]